MNIPRYLNDHSLIIRELGLSTFQFEKALTILQEAGAIAKGKSGKFEILKPSIYMDTDSLLTVSYIPVLRQLTINHIPKIPLTEKTSFSATFTGNEAARIAIHENFLKFLKETERLVGEAPTDEVYQINFDLFPWSLR